jgi:carbonic anhydrase/acetyltransferase-like protein (isoleucine patch superfamily)
VRLAGSAVVLGEVAGARDAWLAQGAVVRSRGQDVRIGAGSAVLETCVVIGPTTIGLRTVFGHRCMVVGAEIGDLCEIGNGSILMPGARVGHRVFLGEGTLVPSGVVIPDHSVVVGRPGRTVRQANDDDLKRLLELRGGDLSLPTPRPLEPVPANGGTMGATYEFNGVWPAVADSAVLFDSAELTGDVVVGERTIIGAGVKIIGDSHGPVRIGSDVQILENTVLHLLPHNDLVIGDGVIIGPGCMIHGCRIGAGSVVEPGSNVCDFSELGRGCVVQAGSVVKQRSEFGDFAVVDGFPAKQVDTLLHPPAVPAWAFRLGDVERLVRRS